MEAPFSRCSASPREFKVMDAPPPDYERFIVEEVRPAGENLTIRYGGRVFGGIVRCLLPSQEVEAALEPGCELFVRYHRPDTGQPGQVAHMLIRHPSEPGWAEVYSEID